MSNNAIQNSAEPFAIFADDETAIGTGKTGLTITATLCKNGAGSFSSVSPTIAELGGGWYRVTPIAAHRDTLGESVWAFAATGAIIAGRREVVGVAFSNATVADAVWDEQYSQHTAAGTFGKLFDIWRKSNPAIDGVVTASVTPTTTTFSTNITGYPSGAFIHSVLLFVNGSTNAESNSPIVGYVSANGVITLEEPMQAAVQVGDEFVIAANSHVHPIASIAAGIWNSLLATYQAVGSFGKALGDTKADTTAILANVDEVETKVDTVIEDTEDILTGVNALNNNHRGEFF